MAITTPANTPPYASPEAIRIIEEELSQPLFCGMPVGPTLGSLMVLQLYHGLGDWSIRESFRNRVRYQYRKIRPIQSTREIADYGTGKILVTLPSTRRVIDLVIPVLHELGHDRCLIVCSGQTALEHVPPDAHGVLAEHLPLGDVSAWRKEYRRCWPEWKKRLKKMIGRFDLPRTFFQKASLNLLTGTQRLQAARRFMDVLQPPAVITEYDRSPIWAPVILAAKSLGIPTYTMVHGVCDKEAVSFVPVLADTVFCWGQLGREQFIQLGVNPEKLVVGGCPRMTRGLPIRTADARRKIALDPDRPVVMLGTAPFRDDQRFKLADSFCRGMTPLSGVSAIVRLHASEKVEDYAPIIKRYPQVKFLANSACSLDESLAASDIVVVHHSGLGGDALIKRRLTIILDVLEIPLSYGRELIEQAGCPRAASSGELTEFVREILHDDRKRREYETAAEKYVERFCAAFGQDAAKRIADHVLSNLATRNKAES